MILSVGATGALGGDVTRRLLAQGQDVRVLVRPPSDHSRLVDAGASPVFGDLTRPDTLRAACAGVDVVVTTANSAARGGADTVESVDLRGNQALIDAAREAGVGRFVFVSALGADPTSPVPFMAAKGATEAALRASGLEHVIVSPNVFMDTWIPALVGLPLQASAPVTLVGEGARRHTFIALEDVAGFTTAAATAPAAANRQLVVGGPEALSWTEVVARCGQALGREIPVRYVAPGTPFPGLPDMVAQMATVFETYDSVFDTTPLAREFEVRQTPLEAFLEKMLAPLRQSPGPA